MRAFAFAFDRLDRYALRQFTGPLAAVLATLLVAQLLERLLRLIDLATSAGAPLSSVGVMFAELVPHYLGLTLPMSFTAAIFIAAARMSDDNELDVMLSSGRSIARIAAPYFVLAVALLPFDLYLFGHVQPLARYGYHAATDDALQTGWDAKVEDQQFVGAGDGYTFSVGAVEADGRHLREVFLVHRKAGVEEVTTAARGNLLPGPGGRGLVLRLEDGLTLRDAGGDTLTTIRFAEDHVDQDLSPVRKPFRPRGDAANERTFSELWAAMRQPGGDAKSAAEFHSRLARVVILPLLPLLALPLGMASKRGRRSPGVVFATLALVGVNHALQFGKSLAENGRVAAALAVWTPFALFTLLCVWIFRGSLAWPGDNPVSRAVGTIEGLLEGVLPKRLTKRLTRSASGAGS